VVIRRRWFAVGGRGMWQVTYHRLFRGRLACAGDDPQYSDKPVIEGARPKWCGDGRSREEDVGNGFERFQRSFLSAEGYLR
jgi:hypothetical protein